MPTVVLGGVRVRYEVRGRGRPILLLHGFSSSYRGTWQRTGWVDLLVERGFQTVGPDIRGHGASDKPHDPAAYAPEVLAADAVALLDELEIERADLFGYSLGGGIALRLAEEHADRVRSVVAGGVGDAALNRLADGEQLAAIADALEARTDAEASSNEAQRLRDNALHAGNDLRALAACMRNGRGWPGGLDELGPITAPVLLVVAERDQYMRGHEALAAAIPGVKVVSLAGRDHHDALGDPLFRDVVLEFLGRRR